MRGALAVFTACLIFPQPAAAQSANNFDTKPIAPKEAAGKAKADNKKDTAPPQASPAANLQPSRFVGETDLAAYVQTLSTVLTSRSRTTDPFGQIQDPDAKPVIRSTAPTKTRVTQVQTIPFSDIINKIKINTIMPGEGKFLIGTRSYKEGDHLTIIHRGKNITVLIASVKASRIEFRNVETGENAILKIELLPAGMTPGSRGITPPGMVPSQLDAPINLDNGNS